MCSPQAFKDYETDDLRNSKKSTKVSVDGLEQHSVTKFFKRTEPSMDRNGVATQAIVKYVMKSMKPISAVKNEAFVSMWKEVEPDYKLSLPQIEMELLHNSRNYDQQS